MNTITKEFKKYKLPISNEKMEDFCLPKKFSLQPQQQFLPELLKYKDSPWNTNRGILVYHQIGAGKTCTAISVAETFKNKKNIVVVLPASLIGNFKNELLSECAGDNYMKPSERVQLKKLKPDNNKFKLLLEKGNKRINKYYKIYSYHKFIALIEDNKIKKLNNTLLIIDEVQNMISMNGTFYKLLKKIIESSNNTLKILLLSATPMFDKPIEIALTLNLLKTNDYFNISKFNHDYIDIHNINKGIEYSIKNNDDFTNKIKNLVSYYRGAPPKAYPKLEFKVIKCKMSDFHYKSYLTSLSSDEQNIKGSFKNVDILNLPQNFFLGPRMISNIAFPNKSIGDIGFSSFNGDVLLLYNIKKYSIKFYKILKKIKLSEGPVFIYSNFKDYGGIKCLLSFLNYHGYKNYKDFGEGDKTYAVWSSDEPHHLKEQLKYAFNQPDNYNGSKIKIILGTPSIKEGVSLLRVEQVHILEPYWNMSRLLQIMGRAVRFCSHKDVPKNKRFVQVYLYLATYSNIKTIDQYIWELAKQKNKLIEQFEVILKESAIDCELFYNRNSYKTDTHVLKCKH
jgi:superfamily II DNA or RNA helicase